MSVVRIVLLMKRFLKYTMDNELALPAEATTQDLTEFLANL